MAIVRPAHDRRECDRCRELVLQEWMLPEYRTTTLRAMQMRAWHQPRGYVELDTGRVHRDGPAGLDTNDPELLWGDPG